MKRDIVLAHIAVLIVNLVYGGAFTIAKMVTPTYILPFGFVLIRVFITSILFISFHSIFIREKIEKKDLPRLAALGLFGVAINQLFFIKGLSMTSPINAAIIMTTSPILVLMLAALILKERLSLRKGFGITLGIAGACGLILMRKSGSLNLNSGLGDLFILLNALSWGLFLILVKPMMQKYRPLTVIMWTFIFGFFIVLPFGWSEVPQVDWQHMPTQAIYSALYIILGATFMNYLLNTYGLKTLSAPVVSSYIYLQPFFATLIALSLGQDQLDLIKIISSIAIFIGVYLVSDIKKTKPE